MAESSRAGVPETALGRGGYAEELRVVARAQAVVGTIGQAAAPAGAVSS